MRSCDESRRSCDCVSGGSVLVRGESGESRVAGYCGQESSRVHSCGVGDSRALGAGGAIEADKDYGVGGGKGDSRVFESTVIENISALKEQVNELQSEVRQLKLGKKSTQACQQKFCLLYVRVSGDTGKSKLESLLGCEVLQYVRLISNPMPSYKVKIKEGDLDSALANGRSEGCFVARWCDKSCNP